MSFQFLCPQGHLLEGDPSQAGQQCQCPTCGMLFIIPPAPAQAAANPFGAPQQNPWETQQPSPFGAPGQQNPFAGQQSPFGGQPGGFADPQAGAAGPDFAMAAAQAQAPTGPDPFAAQEPRVFHIPCPNGHELETPEEMLDQDVLCPQCQVQFQLREKDSTEYKERMAREQERREEKSAKVWLNWAVAIAVIVVIGLGVMIAMSSAW